MVLDDEASGDMQKIMDEANTSVMEKYPGSFQHHSGRNRGRHRKGKVLASTHDKVVHIFAYLSSIRNHARLRVYSLAIF